MRMGTMSVNGNQTNLRDFGTFQGVMFPPIWLQQLHPKVRL